MQCEKCGSAVDESMESCPACGAPVPQNVEGFDNTMEFQQALRAIVVEYSSWAVADPEQFVGLLGDYVPDYKKERRFLISMYRQGVLRIMLNENVRELGIMKAKNFMLTELFIADNAVEFVIACFTYMLGWPYTSTLKVTEGDGQDNSDAADEKKTSFNVEANVFTPKNARKYRLTSNVTIPEGVTKIESFCFDKYGSMKTIKLPSSLIAIGDYAFSSCKKLRGIELPENLRVIKEGAFSNCQNLVMVRIPNGVLQIEDSTFSACASLEKIEIPDSVSSIGAEAFACCDRLRKLFLPDSVKFIDQNAFSFCPNLTIYCMENSYVHKYCLATGRNAVIVKSSLEV